MKVSQLMARHVLKALKVLCTGKTRGVSASDIIQRVKIQIKNLKPQPDPDVAIMQSLWMLVDYGLVKKLGRDRFAVSGNSPPPRGKDVFANIPHPEVSIFWAKVPGERRASESPSSSDDEVDKS